MPSNQGNKKKRIVVVGLGLQGWAIVRQLIKLGGDDPEYEVYVYDLDEARENKLLPNEILQGGSETSSVYQAFREGHIQKLRGLNSDVRAAIIGLKPHLIINAATFTGHEFYTKIAFDVPCDYIDLGQSTWEGLKQRAFDLRIRESGCNIRMVPECGLAPGLVNILAAWLFKDEVESLQIRVGGLPIDTSKGGELHYGLSWSSEGLIKEYKDVTVARKEGRTAYLFCLTSHEDREEPPQICRGIAPFTLRKEEVIQRLKGRMEPKFFTQAGEGEWSITNLEARPTSDGISLMPFDSPFNSLDRLEYKTLRYQGHFAKIERMDEAGELDNLVLPSATPDLVLLRVWAEETRKIQSAKRIRSIEGVVLCDAALDDQSEEVMEDQLVFTAMQHLTGLTTVLVARALLNYRDPKNDTPPPLFHQQDHGLWSGRSLYTALDQGGVIMPYELVDGGQLLAELDSDSLIPYREFHWSRE